ncbi:hypothetical protein ACRRTK_009498 [Alexandromys fortis]
MSLTPTSRSPDLALRLSRSPPGPFPRAAQPSPSPPHRPGQPEASPPPPASPAASSRLPPPARRLPGALDRRLPPAALKPRGPGSRLDAVGRQLRPGHLNLSLPPLSASRIRVLAPSRAPRGLPSRPSAGTSDVLGPPRREEAGIGPGAGHLTCAVAALRGLPAGSAAAAGAGPGPGARPPAPRPRPPPLRPPRPPPQQQW